MSLVILGPGHGSAQNTIPGLEDLKCRQTDKYISGGGKSHKEKVKR